MIGIFVACRTEFYSAESTLKIYYRRHYDLRKIYTVCVGCSMSAHSKKYRANKMLQNFRTLLKHTS